MSRKQSFLTIVAALLLAGPVMAQDQSICDDLRGQLANLTETIGTNHQARQYQDAIAEQAVEIRNLANDLVDNECSAGSMVIINSQDDGSCARIENKLQQMKQNLRDLVAKRDQILSGGAEGATRQQLSAALRRNGCDDDTSDDGATIISNRPDPRLDAVPLEQGSILPLDHSGGPATGYDDNPQSPIPTYGYGQSQRGDLRTVCVRTCDGGFFPMPQNAGAVDFQRDGATCARMCPEVKTELFVHKPEQETSAMVSASSGVPYSAMPYAFAFRKRQPNEKTGCSCNLPAYYEEMRRGNAATYPPAPNQLQSPGNQQITGQQQGSITTINPKPAPPKAATAPSAPLKADSPPVERPYDPAAAKVRQVGPAFLSSDQHQLDLSHPAAPGPQPEQ